MTRRWTTALLTVLLAFGVVSPARAATFKWTRVGPSAANYAQARLARTDDAVLHLLWVANNVADTTKDDILSASISPDGTLGATVPVQTGWPFIDPVPDLLDAPDGSLRAFWGGTGPSGPSQTLNTATAPSTGTPWTLQAGGAAPSDAAFGSAAATFATDGTPIEVSGSAWVHRGLSPSTPAYDYHADFGACCAYGANIGTDKVSGEVYAVWYADARDTANPDGALGVYARRVDPATGAPAAVAVRMPGSVTMFNGDEESSNPIGRIPVEARAGGGLYAAFAGGYPSVDKVLVWRIGDAQSIKVATSGNLNDAVEVESTSDGRLWAVWSEDANGRPKVMAALSNENLTEWSPPVSVSVPSSLGSYVSLYELDADAGSGSLDVVVNLSDGTDPSTSFWHVRLPQPQEWTSGPDVLTGSAAADFLYGGSGKDTLKGQGGADRLYGGNDPDSLDGGPGKDVLNGGKGKDTCRVTKGDKVKSCDRIVGRRNF